MPRLDAETLDLVLSTLREYAARELTPEVLLDLDHHDRFPEKVLRDLYDPAQIGIHLLFMPEEYGGLGGGAYDIYRVSTAMAEIDLGIATGVLATFLGTDPITVGGTPEQKAKWMTRLAEEGLLVAYGATEPHAGSDLSSLSTSATPIVNDGRIEAYSISGQKQWISNGGVASVYTVLANAPGGPSWFIVERGTPGFSPGKPENKHGIRASNTTALYLDNVVVPAENLVGGVEGHGLAQAQAVFGYTRVMVAAFGLGAGWAALQRTIRYSQQRLVGGVPLAQKQGYTHKLVAPHACRLEAARAYIEWTAERIDNGEPDLATEGAVAKYMATEAGNRAAEDAIQGHGGNGYTKEYFVEKIKRDVRITLIYEGTSEILEWTIARDRWQHHLKTRGAYYIDWAARLDRTLAGRTDTGGPTSALALRALAALLERARLDRLTRHQHVLFRLGEIVAFVETAAIFSERAALSPTTATTLAPETFAAMARVHAREAAQRAAFDGLRWAVGAGQSDPALARTLGLEAAAAAQAGLIDDLGLVTQGLIKAFPA